MQKILIFLLILPALVSGQPVTDSLRIGLDSAEALFLRQNYQLLAQEYNIDAQKAQVIQARLFPNPNLSFAHVLYQTETKEFFPIGPNGETSAQLSQLLYLAGKRNKQIKIAEANVKLAEYQFFDLIRTLKFELRSDFFNIYYLKKSASVYNEEISSLQQVVKAFNDQLGKGYISEKEVVRIKAQLYALQAEYNSLTNQINDLESELRLILQIKKSAIDPQVDTMAIAMLNPNQYPLNMLLDSAYKNRTDLLIARQNTQISKLNYNYQKSLAVPDITLSLEYDKAGSYITNYNAIGAAIDLPFFSRNQGNIKSAKSMIDFNQTSEKGAQATVEENVFRSLQKAFDFEKMYLTIDPTFSGDFNRLLHEVLVNYQRRNISILDFLDFYDSYKENILQINSIQFGRLSAFEELNFYTGTNFYNK